MGATAIVFDAGMSLDERKFRAEKLAEQFHQALAKKAKPLAAILCGGRSLTVAAPDSENYQRLTDLRGSLLIGVYKPGTDLSRITRDVEETLSEYFDGCVIPKIIRA